MTIDQVNPDLLYLAYWLSPYIDRLIGLLSLLVFGVLMWLVLHGVGYWGHKLLYKGAK